MPSDPTNPFAPDNRPWWQSLAALPTFQLNMPRTVFAGFASRGLRVGREVAFYSGALLGPGLLMAEADIPSRFLPAIRLVVNNLVWIFPLVAIEQLVAYELRTAVILGILFVVDLAIAVKWGFLEGVAGKFKDMSGVQLALFVGIIGTWTFLTLCLGTVAWMIWTRQAVAAQSADDSGPIRWTNNFSIEGPLLGKVFSLRFLGVNISRTEALQLKQANIVSAIDGTLLPLEISAVSAAGENRIVAIDKVQLIPPGARIELVAKFGDPDPNAPGKVLSLDSKAFLEKWRQFSFSVTDNTRTYRIDYDDRAMMAFFQGMVGPRVTLKPAS